MAASFRIEDFVGEITGEQKGLSAALVHGKAQPAVVAVKSDKDSSLVLRMTIEGVVIQNAVKDLWQIDPLH